MNVTLPMSRTASHLPNATKVYRVVLLPTQEIALERASLGEASTFANTYNQVMLGTERQALVELEAPLRTPRLRRRLAS